MEEVSEVVARPPRLLTANHILDEFLGGFEPGQLTFVDSGSPFVHDLTFLLCVRCVLDFDRDVVFVDGGNSMNPYTIASIARRSGAGRREVLDRIRVARAFTAYQMASILLESLEEEVRAGPGLLILACLPELFLDEEVEYQEAYHLLRRGLRKSRELVREEELVGVVTNYGLSRLSRRRGIGNLLYQMADRVVRVRPVKGGLLLTLPREGRSIAYRPVPPNQTILEDYCQAGSLGTTALEWALSPTPAGRQTAQQTEILSFCRPR